MKRDYFYIGAIFLLIGACLFSSLHLRKQNRAVRQPACSKGGDNRKQEAKGAGIEGADNETGTSERRKRFTV